MTHLLSILLFLFPFFCSSQVWVEQNATWHYDYWNIGSGGFYRLEYTQDTVVGGQICQKIATKKFSFASDQFGTIQLQDSTELPPQFTYVSGDTVFYWNDNQFFTLFHFGADIGDQWLIGASNPQALSTCSDSSFVEVTDTGSVTINAVSYRTITLEPVDSSSLGLSGVFVERFGFLDHNQPFLPFPREMHCDGTIVEYDILSFKCFEDDALSLYNPSGEDCEYYLTHLTVDENHLSHASIYPNPFTDFIEIIYLNDGTLTIYNAQGALIESRNYFSSEKIDLSHLQAGFYLFEFRETFDSIFQLRVLKQE